jgi:NADPH:quinone reductase-like Zn-dependent oxidoreductase
MSLFAEGALHGVMDVATMAIQEGGGDHGDTTRPPRRSEWSEMMMQPTMRAAVRERYGEADVIRVGQVPVPTIADDEVLIRVRAAGVDRGTWHLMTGTPYLARLAIGLRRPREAVLGRDVAGTVLETGSEARRFSVGDSVFGVAPGSFAEYAKAKERKLAPTPDGLSAAEAAVLGISGMTALQAVDAADLNAGSTALIIGASGGVGSFAVQIALAIGAQVTGVCRQTKVDFVRSLGVERVIAYDAVGDSDYGGPYDAIIDTGGDTPIATLRTWLTPSGTLVIVGGEGGDAVTGMGRQLHARFLSMFVHQRLTFIVNRERQADLQRLGELVETGAVKPTLDTAYPLEDAAEAIRQLTAGRVEGKLAIAIDEAATRRL